MVFAEPAERSASVPPDVPPNSGGTFREATAEHSAESSRNNCGTFRGTTEKHSASVPPCSARNVPNNKKEGIKSELNTTPSQAGLVSEDEREREDLISWGWEIAQAEKLKDVTGEPVTMGHVQAWVDDRMSSGWERPSGQKIKPENRKADLRKFLSVTRSDKAQKSGISSRIVQEKQAARSAQRKCPLSNGTGKVLVAMRLVEISKGVKVKCPVDISNDWRDGAGVEFVEDQCPCQDCSPTLDEKTRATVMAAVRRS
jgi:hypothetical protein